MLEILGIEMSSITKHFPLMCVCFYINKITFVTRYMYGIEGDIASLSLAFNVLTKA